MTKTKTIYRPVVIAMGRQRPLKDQEFDTVAETHLDAAVREDAEVYGKAEGYVLKVLIAEKVKEDK